MKYSTAETLVKMAFRIACILVVIWALDGIVEGWRMFALATALGLWMSFSNPGAVSLARSVRRGEAELRQTEKVNR